MSKEDVIEIEGIVVEKLQAMFKVELEMVTGTCSYQW